MNPQGSYSLNVKNTNQNKNLPYAGGMEEI